MWTILLIIKSGKIWKVPTDSSAEWYFVASCKFTLKGKCPEKLMNVNRAAFYYAGRCTYNGSLEIKCWVSGGKKLIDQRISYTKYNW